MNPEDFKYFQSRVTRFVSGSSSGIKFGSSVAPRYTRLSSIIPKRALPQQILSTLQRTTSDNDGIEASSRGITALGKVTLNIEQTKNNLEKIIQIIAEDYKTTQETNRKETDDLRKRIANRGRIFGKKELGDKKSDVLGTVRKYVGSFFSGAGGAIRALAMFNLLQGILSGDPSKIIGPLLGIGMTYIPSIIGSVIGGVVGSIGTGLVGRMFGGGARAAAPAAGAAAGASGLGKLGKFGGRAALIGSGLALASSMFNKPEEDTQQQRLEQLTEQQKGLVTPTVSAVSIPQNDLQRFESLNKKFENALDFLLKKQKEGGGAQGQRSGGGGGYQGGGRGEGLSQEVTDSITNPRVRAFLDVLAKYESGGAYNRKFGGGTFDDYSKLLSGDEPFGRYQFKPTTYNPIAQRLGITDISPKSQDLAAVQYLKDLGVLDEIQSGDPRQIQSAIDRLKVSTWTALRKYRPGEALEFYKKRLGSSGGFSSSTSSQSMTPPPTTPEVARRRIPDVPAPVNSGPNVTLVPMSMGNQTSQSSDAAVGNDIVPAIDTTYPENFLALYSKLIYQIV